MTATDFLLQPATQSVRGQASGPAKSSAQGHAGKPSNQEFSAVYAKQQQRSQHADQQQLLQSKQRQARALQEKQQQHTEQAAVKAMQRTQGQPLNPVTTRTETSSSAAFKSSEKERASTEGTAVVARAEAEQETAETVTAEVLDANQEALPDPFLAMLMTGVETEAVSEETAMAVQVATDEDLDAAANLLFADATASGPVTDELTELSLDEEGIIKGQKGQTKAFEFTDKAPVLSSMSGKNSDLLLEKSAAEKSNTAALLESTKAAPETLLDTKAVPPSENIRGDLSVRAEPLLTPQTLRAVPGSAVPMQQPGWTQEVTDRVMWMSSQNLRSAEIKLDPAELGRLDIKVDMTQEGTQITFASAHAGVRDSLESQMYRLREMLNQQGMHNVEVNVSDQAQQEAQSQEQRATQGRNMTGGDALDDVERQSMPIAEQHDGRLGIVDYYA